MSARNHVNIL